MAKKSKKWQYGSIGTVIEATMRPEDLIPAFCEELRTLGHKSKELYNIERRFESATRPDELGKYVNYFETEDSQWDLDSLFDMLEEHAPAWMYFGSHPGDGSDYGFWVSENIEYDFDGLEVDDTSDVPEDYSGEVLHVNDHGNMTLYACKRGKLTEVWSIV